MKTHTHTLRISSIKAWLLALCFALGIAFLSKPAKAQELSQARAVTHAQVPLSAGQSAKDVHFPELSAEYATETVDGWVQIAYPRGTEERVRSELPGLSAFRESIRGELGPDVLGSVRIRIARSPEDMADLAPKDMPPQSYAVAVSYTGQKMVLVSLRAPKTHIGTELGETLRHELTHVAVDDAFGAYPRRVPTWFNEGLAIHYSGEGSLVRRQTLLEAASMNRLIALTALDPNFADGSDNVDLAYAEAGDFIRFLMKDSARFRSLTERTHNGSNFERSLTDAYGSDLRTLDYQWKKEIEQISNWMPGVVTGSVLWIAGAFVLVLGYVRRKFKDKRVVKRWTEEEAAAQAFAEKAALRVSVEAPVDGQDTPFLAHVPEVPRVEHEGDWHTLH
jgi:hypothetical protein